MQNILFLDNLIHNFLHRHNMNQSIMCRQFHLYIYHSVLRKLFLSKINNIYIYLVKKYISQCFKKVPRHELGVLAVSPKYPVGQGD